MRGSARSTAAIKGPDAPTSVSGAGADACAMAVNTLLASVLCTLVLPALLFLVALKLWEVFTVRGRDPGCPLPLPPGSMGLPFIGETLQLILQVSAHAFSSLQPAAALGATGKMFTCLYDKFSFMVERIMLLRFFFSQHIIVFSFMEWPL